MKNNEYIPHDFNESEGEDQSDGLSFPKVVEPKDFELEKMTIGELDQYATHIPAEEIKRLKNDYQIDFHQENSPEIFCDQLQQAISTNIKKLLELYKDFRDYDYKTLSHNEFKEETNFFNSIQDKILKTKQLISDYRVYVDTLNPELAKVYDIPDELNLHIYGNKSQKVKDLLEILEKADIGFGEINKDSSHSSNYRNTLDLRDRPISSFHTIRYENKETGIAEYKIFTKKDPILDISKDNENEKNIIDSEDDNQYEVNTGDQNAQKFLAAYHPGYGSLGHFLSSRKKEQLYIIAKIMQLYDLPELADRKINFHDFIEIIRAKIDIKDETFKNNRKNKNIDVYWKQRDFIKQEENQISYIEESLRVAHETNILKRTDDTLTQQQAA